MSRLGWRGVGERWALLFPQNGGGSSSISKGQQRKEQLAEPLKKGREGGCRARRESNPRQRASETRALVH